MKLRNNLLTMIMAVIMMLATASCFFDDLGPIEPPIRPTAESRVLLNTTPVPTATPTDVPTEDCQDMVVRPHGENEYLITGCNYTDYKEGELLVVYYRDPSGLELVAAVMQVVEENPDNRVALVVFGNSKVDLASLSALRVDREISQVNLERLVPVNESFVGFILEDEPRIRIRPDAELQVGDELEAKRLSIGGHPISFDSPINMTIDKIEEGDSTATVRLLNGVSWPPPGTLLVVNNTGGTYNIQVSDNTGPTNICLRKGYNVEVQASGNITVGTVVGDVAPEGKENFLLLGFPTPIDQKYDVVKAFRHGVLMYRIENSDVSLAPDEAWLSYHEVPRFKADETGCLAFNINDNQKENNYGQFDVEVIITP